MAYVVGKGMVCGFHGGQTMHKNRSRRGSYWSVDRASLNTIIPTHSLSDVGHHFLARVFFQEAMLELEFDMQRAITSTCNLCRVPRSSRRDSLPAPPTTTR